MERPRALIHAEANQMRLEVIQLTGELRGELSGLRKDLSGELNELRKDLSGDLGALRKDVSNQISGLIWRLITWTTTLGTGLVAAAFLIARYVH